MSVIYSHDHFVLQNIDITRRILMLITLRAQREDYQQQLRAQWQDFQHQLQPTPEQVLSMMAYTGRFRPKGVPLKV